MVEWGVVRSPEPESQRARPGLAGSKVRLGQEVLIGVGAAELLWPAERSDTCMGSSLFLSRSKESACSSISRR